MNQNLINFMAETQPKYPLRKYEEEIITLLHTGFTQIQILEYLEKYYNFKTTRQTLSKHIAHMKKSTRVVREKSENSYLKTGVEVKKTISKEDFLNKVKNG